MWKILLWGALLISAYWLWPIYILIGFAWAFIVADTSGLSSYSGGSYRPSRRRRTYKPKPYKPYKIKFKKRIVYKPPRYKKPKPTPKGRWLKSGMKQSYHYSKITKRGYWWPPAPKNRP